MIPVLGIPVISRPDLLAACIGSIDEPVGRLVVIDNSPSGEMGDAARDACPPVVMDLCVTRPPANLGYSGSINHVIKTHPDAPWWAIANADTRFGTGDLAALEREMADGGPRWVGVSGDWRVFGLSAAAVALVGLWDENYHPCYVEDCDYEYRCRLAGVPFGFIPGTSTHVGSATIKEPRYAERNATSYPSNVAYHEAKWGGGPRGGERFTTPFDRGGSVADWTLDLGRLAANRW